MIGEGRGREDQREALFSLRDISNNTINHRIRASDEGLLNQANTRVIEDLHAEVLVRGDYVDCVHVHKLPG